MIMAAKVLFGHAAAAMWAFAHKAAHRVPAIFLLLFCGLFLLAGRGSAQLSNSEIQALFVNSLQNGEVTTDYPEFKSALSHRIDFGKHSRREYLVFNGYGYPARQSGSLKEVCVIKEDWHFKRPELIEINQFIICQPAYNTVDSFRSHKLITEDNTGSVLGLVWTKFSGKQALAVQRKVADKFLAETDTD
jgi:hypothetical protein